MVVIAVSDLHIRADSNSEEMIERIRKIKTAASDILPEEKVLLVFCGDMFEHGNFSDEALEKVEMVMTEFEKTFPGSQKKIIPGNHDLYDRKSIEKFDEVARKYQSSGMEFSKKSAYSEIIENVNFIFANSCKKTVEGFSHERSNIDVKTLKANINLKQKNVLIMHHSFVNDGKKDSPLDAYNILKSGIEYVINGHRHSSMQFEVESVGVKKVFSLGKFFSFNSNGNADSPSQFAYFKICSGDIIAAWNCKYDGDKKTYIREIVYGEDYVEVESFKSEMPVIPEEKNRYITRTVCAEESETLAREKSQLVDILQKKKRGILLADAGVGKTTELSRLNKILFKERGYYPIYIQLSGYTDKPLEEYKPPKLRKSDTIFAFILDGYDELQVKDRNDFKRRVDEYVKSDARALVLISSRRNFYYNTIGKQNNFQKFAKLFLNSISKGDIDNIIEEENLNTQHFHEIVYQKCLTGLIYNPFYLFHIVEKFKRNNDLPQKNEIMDDIIIQCFDEDIAKYGNTEDLESNKLRLNNLLEKCALSIQINQRQRLTDNEYQTLFGIEERALLKYSGVWIHEENGWKFLHNIFREFLTAKALENMSVNKIREIIPQQDKENTYWQETLSFLVSSSSCRLDIIDWVKENYKQAIVRAESLTITDEERLGILKDILDEVETLCLWLGQTAYKAEDLARFACNSVGLEYLTAKLECCKQQGKNKMICNILDILKYMRDCGAVPQGLQDMLLNFLEDDRFYVNARVIKVISKLGLHDEKTTSKIMQNFGVDINEYLVEAIGEYFIEGKICEENIAYLLKLSQQKGRTLRMHYNILEALKTINSHTGIVKIIDSFAKHSEKELDSQDEEVLREVYGNAAAFYNKGEHQEEIFGAIIDAMGVACDGFSSSRLKRIKEFVNNTNTNLKVFLIILEKDRECKRYYVWEEIFNDECAAKAVELYDKGELPSQAFQYMTLHMIQEKSSISADMQKAIRQKEGIDLTPQMSWEERKRLKDDERQEYFNLLFDKEAYLESVKELIRVSGNPDITFGEIREMYLEFKDYPLLRRIRSDIMRFHENDKVVEFRNKVDWEYFVAHNTYELLTVKDSEVKISEEKVNWLKIYCDGVFARKIIAEDKSIHLTWAHVYAWKLSILFDFKIDHDVLLDFLVADNAFLEHGGGLPTVSSRIVDVVSKDQIVERILYNLREIAVNDHIKAYYFDYLREQEIGDAISEAEELIVSTKDEYLWQQVLAYIVRFRTVKYISGMDLSSLSEVQIGVVVMRLEGAASRVLDEELIRRYDETRNMPMLKHLICRNNLYGLQKYYEMAKEKNAIPDGNEEEDSYNFLTDELGEICDIKCLPIMIELFALSHRESFKDATFGVKRATSESLQRIASLNYNEVRNKVLDLDKEGIGEELCGACNFLLKQIDLEHNALTRKPWAMKEIKELYADVF